MNKIVYYACSVLTPPTRAVYYQNIGTPMSEKQPEGETFDDLLPNVEEVVEGLDENLVCRCWLRELDATAKELAAYVHSYPHCARGEQQADDTWRVIPHDASTQLKCATPTATSKRNATKSLGLEALASGRAAMERMSSRERSVAALMAPPPTDSEWSISDFVKRYAIALDEWYRRHGIGLSGRV